MTKQPECCTFCGDHYSNTPEQRLIQGSTYQWLCSPCYLEDQAEEDEIEPMTFFGVMRAD